MQDDEILDDDFDIEDDFEDDFDLDDDSDPLASEEPVTKSGNSSSQKTLLQKLFVPIVIGVVAIFGLIFAASQGLFSSPPQQDIQTENIVATVDTAGVADIPESAPDIIEKTEDALPPIEEIANIPEQPSIEPDDSASLTPLTPLPEDDVGELESLELVDLNAELQDISNNEVPQEPDIDALGLIEEPLAAEEPPEEESVAEILEADNLDTNNNNLEVEVSEDIVVEDIVAVPPGSDVTGESAEEIEMPPLETVSADLASIDDDLEVLKDEKSSLMQEKESLEQDISEKLQIIEELTGSIEALRAEQKALEKPATPVKPETAEVVDIEVKKKSEAKPVRVASKVVWELRSAQPGKAALSKSGSNDLKHIEVGNVLAGLGRITSIQVENGLWVVRGTKGTISQ